jgi:hypothetical protein
MNRQLCIVIFMVAFSVLFAVKAAAEKTKPQFSTSPRMAIFVADASPNARVCRNGLSDCQTNKVALNGYAFFGAIVPTDTFFLVDESNGDPRILGLGNPKFSKPFWSQYLAVLLGGVISIFSGIAVGYAVTAHTDKRRARSFRQIWMSEVYEAIFDWGDNTSGQSAFRIPSRSNLSRADQKLATKFLLEARDRISNGALKSEPRSEICRDLSVLFENTFPN